MLYKNFLKLSFSHHKTALCFNSDGTLLLFQTLHKPQVGKFPNDNSFSVNPRAYPPDARRVSKEARALARRLVSRKFTRAYVRVRTARLHRVDRRGEAGTRAEGKRE